MTYRVTKVHLLGSLLLILVSLGAFFAYLEQTTMSTSYFAVLELNSPITHTPSYLGIHSFILGSGNVVQNGAYSYVWINASELKEGDSFFVYPALNIGLIGPDIDQSNFTLEVIYFGSMYGASPYWLNFSIIIPPSGIRFNSSQIGIQGGLHPRTGVSLPDFRGAELFTQISNVVETSNQFEFFSYIGNSSTPSPQLTHTPVH